MKKNSHAWFKELSPSALAALVLGVVLGGATIYLYLITATESRIVEMDRAISSAIQQNSAIEQRIREYEIRIQRIQSNLESIQDLRGNLDAERLDALEQILGRVEDEGGFNELLDALRALNDQLRTLGVSRDGRRFNITNPRMGGRSAAECPPGYFVSAIVASKGVGGAYAVDGISELSVTCSSLISDNVALD